MIENELKKLFAGKQWHERIDKMFADDESTLDEILESFVILCINREINLTIYSNVMDTIYDKIPKNFVDFCEKIMSTLSDDKYLGYLIITTHESDFYCNTKFAQKIICSLKSLEKLICLKCYYIKESDIDTYLTEDFINNHDRNEYEKFLDIIINTFKYEYQYIYKIVFICIKYDFSVYKNLIQNYIYWYEKIDVGNVKNIVEVLLINQNIDKETINCMVCMIIRILNSSKKSKKLSELIQSDIIMAR